MPASENAQKSLKSGGEVGDVPADANPSGPTTNPQRLDQIKRQQEQLDEQRRQQEKVTEEPKKE